jgi:hypothetical protein
MSETKNDKAPKAPKIKAKTALKFSGPNGDLMVVMNRIAPNNIQTFVVHTKTGGELTSKGKLKKIRSRGASELHKDETSAKTAVDKIVAQAVKMGWVAKGKVRNPKSDSFDLAHLPAAKK